MLWWGYRFWFLLIFWILHVHETGPFMPKSSFFIYFWDVSCPYWMVWFLKNSKKEFDCTKCKASFNFFFQHFWLFHTLIVRMSTHKLHTCILSDFSGINNLSGLNDLNSLSALNYLYSLNFVIIYLF